MQSNDWVVGSQAWTLFTQHHPELGLKPGLWQFHNFLRIHREALIACDAIRKARARHWIAHVDRFISAAFDCATGFPVRTQR
jgi:hypothetical protein